MSQLTAILGEGLYEAVLIHRGRPVLLEEHLARLRASATALDLWQPDWQAVTAECRQAASAVTIGRLRIGLLRPLHADWRVVVEAAAEEPARGPVRLATAPRELAPPEGLARHKTISRMPYHLAREHARRLGADDALLVDRTGAVTEASSANVFAVIDGRLVTPGTDGPLLPGVTRAAIIALAAEMGVEVVERTIAHAELLDATELFLTSAIAGVRPASSLDGREIPGPWPLCGRLAQAYAERWLSGW